MIYGLAFKRWLRHADKKKSEQAEYLYRHEVEKHTRLRSTVSVACVFTCTGRSTRAGYIGASTLGAQSLAKQAGTRRDYCGNCTGRDCL